MSTIYPFLSFLCFTFGTVLGIIIPQRAMGAVPERCTLDGVDRFSWQTDRMCAAVRVHRRYAFCPNTGRRGNVAVHRRAVVNTLGSDGQVEITTSMRVRAWWLTTFRGYALESKRRVPHESAFGAIYYKNRWVLTKQKDK